MNKSLLKKKQEKPLFKRNPEDNISSDNKKAYKFAFYRIVYIFVLSFAISFFVSAGLIYFQLRHFISPSLD